ncbi:MAG: hypothetical protein AB8G05_06165 [Oligoflexales bacterium]
MAAKNDLILILVLSACTSALSLAMPAYCITKSELLRKEDLLSRNFDYLQAQNKGSKFIYRIAEKNPLDIERSLENWNQEISRFYQQLDSFILEQQLFYLEESFENARALYVRIGEVRSYQKDLKVVTKIFSLLQVYYNRYLSNLEAFATGKDYRRINPYINYFRQYRDLLGFLNYTKKRKKPWNKKLRQTVIRHSMQNPGLIKEVFRPKNRTSSSQPLTELVIREGQLLRDVFDNLEVQVEINGQENIPSQNFHHLDTNKVVNIFAHQHGHGIIDELIKAHIPIPHYMIMWAVKIGPIPRFMHPYLEQSASVIPVGARKDALTSTMDRLEQKFSDNIAIHPQGELNIFNEVMPVHKNFSHRYLKTLRENGYHINLIPVSSQYAPVFLTGCLDDMKAHPGGNLIKASIEPVLNSNILDALLRTEAGYDTLIHLLRLIWLEKAVTDEAQILGGLRTQAIEEKFRQRLGDFISADHLGKAAIDQVINHFLMRNL